MKFYLIHHAHTDIGYTDRQEKIQWNHARYLESVVDILRASENLIDWKNFCWNVECLWALEAFTARGRSDYQEDFWKYVSQGRIGLSGSYLNLTDLVDERVFREALEAALRIPDQRGVHVRCAMTADINGYPWGYVSAMADAGITCLLSAVHTHHGYNALGKKQIPFVWEGPDGKQMLVFQSEHYHLGNELNLHGASQKISYMIRDGLAETPISPDELRQTRLLAYARKLKEDGYPLDFAPILVSGMHTDNSPPGPAIIEFVHRWNRKHPELMLEMTTLDRFFQELERYRDTFPVYRGDWTDWWSDGVGSTPDAVRIYREAVRKYHICRNLDPRSTKGVREERMQSARRDLMLYSEHTWGYSSSVSQPAHPMVAMLDARKSMYATRAHEAVSMNLDDLCGAMGETPVVLWMDYRLHLVNPSPVPVRTIARTDMEILFTHEHFRLVREDTGASVPFQLLRVPRGWGFHILADLKPMEHVILRVEEIPPAPPPMLGMSSPYGAEGVRDFAHVRKEDPDWVLTPFEMITPFLHVRWERDRGITSILDRARGRELITREGDCAFLPVYERTPVEDNTCRVRGRMGRNRKAFNTLRDMGSLQDVKITVQGSLLSQVTLSFRLEGTRSAELILTGYRDLPRLDVDFRLHKDSVSDPENLYLTLPFSGEGRVLWADKTGCRFRPRIDQIPGTCCDFYALQNGLAWIDDQALVVETPDVPLISMGSLEAHDIRLCGDAELKNTDRVDSWVMNNFWETNFKADLGGFHQFHYSLRLMDTTDPEACFAQAEAENTGVLCFPSFDVPLK